MPQTQRLMMLGLAAITGLLGLVFAHLSAFVMQLASIRDLPIAGITELPLSLVLGLSVALLVLVVVMKTPRSQMLAREVAEELTRVSWPSREEITHATSVVIVTIVICATYLGLFDAVWLKMTDTFLGVAA